MGARDHHQASADQPVRCALLVVTDTKTLETDTSGPRAFEILQKFGHEVVSHQIVPNKRRKIVEAVEKALKDADVAITIGGTGVSRKDGTVEAVRPLFALELPGFGELFRAMSAEEIGTAAILSRAALGATKKGKVVVCLPGSEAAVRLAVEDILVNELRHILRELRK